MEAPLKTFIALEQMGFQVMGLTLLPKIASFERCTFQQLSRIAAITTMPP